MIILFTVLLPVVGAFAVLALGSRPNARETATLLAGGVTFWHVLGLLHLVREGARPTLTLLEVVPGVSLTTSRSSPTIRLMRDDFPTLGRPTTARLIRTVTKPTSASAPRKSNASRESPWSTRSRSMYRAQLATRTLA